MRNEVWTRYEAPLKSGHTAVRAQVACIDLDDGALVAAATDDVNYLPIGRFEEALTGNDTAIAKVALFAPIHIIPMVNSATGPLDSGDVGTFCYLDSGTEVSATATGRSIFGRVWRVDGSGAGAKVYVQPILAMGPQGPQGDPG